MIEDILIKLIDTSPTIAVLSMMLYLADKRLQSVLENCRIDVQRLVDIIADDIKSNHK